MIHTIQFVTPPIKFAQYERVENRTYIFAKQGKCRIIQRQEHLLAFILPQHPGIRLCLNKLTVPHVTLVVNPSIILGGGYGALCQLTPKLLNICMESISCIFKDFKISFSPDQLILSRIDCTIDITFPKENALEAFLSCVQRTKPARHYHIDRFSKRIPNFKEKNRHSFRMACDDVCLTIYDKSYQLLNEALMQPDEVPHDRLRFEAAFLNPAFQRLFLKYGGGVLLGSSNQTLILGFSNLSLRILRDYFERHMTPGQYLRGDLALQRIDKAHFSAKVKSRMKELLFEVSRCHKGGIAKALETMETKGLSRNELQYILNCFEKINLNPATINGSSGYRMFPSISELLNNEDAFIKPFHWCGNDGEYTL